MIVKYYRLYCDECDKWIDDVETSSIDRAVRIMKQTDESVKITKRLNGSYHIKCDLCAAKEDAKFIVNKYGDALKRLEKE